ncbi:IclR family transcriptional regulator [Herbaspirillum sp. RTI4]|uniref:IclR family transcriptional regulator n=1 Tax=Herbaspirillum sp. RTI4 TaxID=3048640 RepID=UPI002AB45EA1|nr:IclR family transcriptional regulator [Herbaspirillum sp. RTI4]MDY7578778.1 IclR family transcriptional regulator [Herbaspirillum sp. RTI4]MEA9982302.1 IclR family transcriptional regulator [Herbaspirillum sp. RTI4]
MPKSPPPSEHKIVATASTVASEKKENVAKQEKGDASAPRYSAPALEKGLDILELLTETETGLTLNQIAKKLERSVNEIFRMIVTLEQRGYLIAGDGDRYRLTLKLFELSHRHLPIKSLVSTALPHMRELANRTMQSCHLTLYSGGRLIVVAQVDSPERWAFGLKVGALVGLVDTASGYILLSFRDDAERGRMLAEHIKIEGELDVDTAQLLREIQDTKERGFSMMPSKQIRGVTNISYPIFGEGKQSVAALNVPFIERIDKKVNPSREEVQFIVNEIAGRISVLMGCGESSFSL